MQSKREEAKELIRKRILDAAFAEFAEKGYTKTTLSGIAKQAESATGLVNKYFESKENLFCTLIELRVFSNIFNETEDCTLDEALDRFLDAIKSSITSDRTRAEFDRMLVSSKDLPFEVVELFSNLPSARHLVELIGKAQQQGALPSTETAGGLLFALYKGTVIISRWYNVLGLCMPDNDSLLFIMAYDRKALRSGQPTYFARHPAN